MNELLLNCQIIEIRVAEIERKPEMQSKPELLLNQRQCHARAVAVCLPTHLTMIFSASVREQHPRVSVQVSENTHINALPKLPDKQP
jgi:hypothetical protein